MTRETLFTKVMYMQQLEVKCKRVRITDFEAAYFSCQLTSAEAVYRVFRSVFEDSPVELFVVVHLNSNNYVSGFEVVSKGTLNASLVHSREVFRSAILRNAASVIVAHNHPSGNLQPSSEDIQITKKLVQAGKILDIQVLDHVIFTHDGYFSFAENALL